MTERYDKLLKFIIIGDSGTGKSCLLHRFVEGKFIDDQTPTIGVEFGSKIEEIRGKMVKLQVWDTAGQERYRSVARNYYRGAVGCLLVYDITARETYEHVPQWLADARNLAGNSVVVMLVGNKADLSDRRAVTHIEASQFAQQQGLMMFETSCVTGELVNEAFLKVAQSIMMQEVDAGSPSPSADGRADLGTSARSKPRGSGRCSC
eukprot:Hpha_TRINITY_DN16082_c4_g3::TRINITY_DN16082_c4_g3_i1::g.120167::m.120167/K07880/RAB4B; Ras-related protein Rab-4B